VACRRCPDIRVVGIFGRTYRPAFPAHCLATRLGLQEPHIGRVYAPIRRLYIFIPTALNCFSGVRVLRSRDKIDEGGGLCRTATATVSSGF
jgi:hypothetical protein